MQFIDMFCGIGGFRLGLEMASPKYKAVWSNDNDKYACQIYKKHFGDKELHEGNIRAIDASTIPEHDLLCAGFPCQSFSKAGKRRGFEDTRGTLFFEICRVLRDKRPSYVFLENVDSLLSHDNGRTFTIVLQSLSEMGYDCQWQLLNSKDFDVPQDRERTFIVGHIRDKPRPKVFPFNEGHQVSCKMVAEVIGLTPSGLSKQSDRIWGIHGVSPTLTASFLYSVVKILELEDGQNYEDAKVTIDGKNQVVILHRNTPTTSRGFISPQTPGRNIRETRLREQGKENSGIHRRMLLARLPNAFQATPNQPTLLGLENTREHRPGQDSDRMSVDEWLESLQDMGTRVRHLTPIEYERIQGFPDDWTKGIPDKQRYKCIGNAVCPEIIKQVGERLLEH